MTMTSKGRQSYGMTLALGALKRPTTLSEPESAAGRIQKLARRHLSEEERCSLASLSS